MTNIPAPTDLIETEVLIIGCGIAGCTAAINLADAGVPVTVVTRARAPEDSNCLLYTSPSPRD